MDFFDVIRSTDILLGIVVTLFGFGTGFFVWFDRRVKRGAADIAGSLREDHAASARRLNDVEARVIGLSKSIDGIEQRVGHTERMLETVARSTDVANVQSSIANLSREVAATSAQVTAVSGTLDTLMRAALAAGQKE